MSEKNILSLILLKTNANWHSSLGSYNWIFGVWNRNRIWAVLNGDNCNIVSSKTTIGISKFASNFFRQIVLLRRIFSVAKINGSTIFVAIWNFYDQIAISFFLQWLIFITHEGFLGKMSLIGLMIFKDYFILEGLNRELNISTDEISRIYRYEKTTFVATALHIVFFFDGKERIGEEIEWFRTKVIFDLVNYGSFPLLGIDYFDKKLEISSESL